MSKVTINTEQLEKDAEKLLKEAKKKFSFSYSQGLYSLYLSFLLYSATKGFFNRHPDYRESAKKAEEASNKLRLASKKKEAAEAMAQSAEYYQLADKFPLFHLP